MSNIKFFWQNDWDGKTLTGSSENALWPVENTQQRWRSKAWRSRHGAGSGWGRFVINSSNDSLYFDEGSGSLTATITTGTYSADTLAAEIETQLEASGTHLYTVYYDDANNVFVIEDDSGTVVLELSSTTNAIWSTIGFTGTSDTSAAAIHTADEIRIHTAEYIQFTGTETLSIDACFVMGNNISDDGAVYMLTSDDGFATAVTTNMYRYEDMWVAVPASTISCTGVRIYIVDPTNPDGYVLIGRVWCGPEFEPEIGFDNKSEPNVEDKSIVDESEGWQSSGIELPQRVRFKFGFDHVLEADRILFKEMFSDRGILRPFVSIYAIDGVWDDPEERTIYGRFKSYPQWKYKSGVWALSFEIIAEG